MIRTYRLGNSYYFVCGACNKTTMISDPDADELESFLGSFLRAHDNLVHAVKKEGDNGADPSA